MRTWIPIVALAAALGLAENGVRPLDGFSVGFHPIFRPMSMLFRPASGPENQSASNFSANRLTRRDVQDLLRGARYF
jgi:hypothetical protein